MKNMLILDCENYNAILNSIENIFDVERKEVKDFLKNINLDKIFQNEEIYLDHYEYLYKEFIQKFGVPIKEIKAYWFHNTRVPINTNFSEGILPLQLAIPKIEKIIEDIAMNLGINQNKESLLFCNIIQHKLKTETDAGPWGFLIKDFALEVPYGIHDYLKCPEVVEDIVGFRYKKQYEEILNEFNRRTVPCIIKFRNDKVFHSNKLAYVIYYLYHKENNLEIDRHCNTNTSNYGQKISFDKIEKIDFIKNYN